MSALKRGKVLKAARLDARSTVPWGARASGEGRAERGPAGSRGETGTGADAVREPQIEVLRTDGNIEAIQVSCACGRVHRLELIEPTTSNGGGRTSGSPAEGGDKR